MTKPLVLSIAGLSPWLTDALEARYSVVWLHRVEDRDAVLRDSADEVEMLVTTGIHGVGIDVLDALPRLKLVAVHGVGYDKVDVAHTAAKGIAVTNTPDVLTDDVADMALALILATVRRIAANDRFVRDGRWAAGTAASLGRKVTGARFGIIGLGRIGRAIATRLEGFSPYIAYHNRKPVESSPYRYVEDAVTLAGESDVLIVAASGGRDARHLIDRGVIDALGPSGYLINIGRGTSIDETALVEALVDKRLAGAGLDVFADEPNVPAELLALDTVVLQPHQASATVQTRIAMADLVMANLIAIEEGRPPVTAVPAAR